MFIILFWKYIAEILLSLVLNTNQSVNQSYLEKKLNCHMPVGNPGAALGQT
jgi:hypothetical protein